MEYAICPDQLGAAGVQPPGFSFDTSNAAAMSDDGCVVGGMGTIDYISIPESGSLMRSDVASPTPDLTECLDFCGGV